MDSSFFFLFCKKYSASPTSVSSDCFRQAWAFKEPLVRRKTFDSSCLQLILTGHCTQRSVHNLNDKLANCWLLPVKNYRYFREKAKNLLHYSCNLTIIKLSILSRCKRHVTSAYPLKVKSNLCVFGFLYILLYRQLMVDKNITIILVFLNPKWYLAI